MGHHTLQLVNFNHDGNLDIFCAEQRLDGTNPHSKIYFFLGDGNGNFKPTVVATGYDSHESKVADLDGNGTLDLLLTDMVMPGMGGRELAAQLIARFPRLSVLYMSGYSVEAIASNGMVDPGTHFLEKPFTTKALVDKVREAIDSRPLIPEA